jgi:N-acetylmuramoyl-L-alanine amidase
MRPDRRMLHAMRIAACALVVLVSAACQSTASEETATQEDPAPWVSSAALAERLGLERRPLDEGGKIVLVAADGDEILLFPETTVASVHGIQIVTAEPIALRSGEAWLMSGDAEAIASTWSSATAMEPRDWTVPPLPLPGPGPRPSRGTTSSSGTSGSAYADKATAAEVRAWTVPLRLPWRYIVIHHSATESGSAAAFDKEHRQVRHWDGLGYDFVINNGNGGPDGLVEVGYRWRDQKPGAHAGPNSPRNRDGIGICLVGDFTKTRPTAAQMRALSRLCNFLSSYCGIPRENFLLHGDVRQTACPGPYFPRDFLAPLGSGRSVSGGAGRDLGTR